MRADTVRHLTPLLQSRHYWAPSSSSSSGGGGTAGSDRHLVNYTGELQR